MNTKVQRTIAGSFRAREIRPGTWQLTAVGPGGGEILIGGAEAAAGDVLRTENVRGVALAWQGDGVAVTLIVAAGARHFRSRTAIIQEPLARLYDGLPLESLDDRARRFWRRVFRLVRIPGGRRLLGLIARLGASRRR